MNFSKHAQIRSQQRGISPLVLSWLSEYGAEKRTHGATKRYFDQKAKKRLCAAVGHHVVCSLGKFLDVYLVEADDGTVITAGHRIQRIWN